MSKHKIVEVHPTKIELSSAAGSFSMNFKSDSPLKLAANFTKLATYLRSANKKVTGLQDMYLDFRTLEGEE